MSNEEMLAKVDHTLLKPYATWADIRQICEDAIAYHTATICIPPSYIGRIREAYGDAGLSVIPQTLVRSDDSRWDTR